MSPADARITSSPCSRHARRTPLDAHSTPKNFRSIGGGGGGGGQFGGHGIGGGSGATGRAGPNGFGIEIGTTGAEFTEKIFRPVPEYCSDSLTSIASMCSVGSSVAEVIGFAFAPPPADRAGVVAATGAGAG